MQFTEPRCTTTTTTTTTTTAVNRSSSTTTTTTTTAIAKAPSKFTAYDSRFKCPVCTGVLGRVPGLVPVILLPMCTSVAHMMCATCAQTKLRDAMSSATREGARCVLCHSRFVEFMPVASLVDEACDEQAKLFMDRTRQVAPPLMLMPLPRFPLPQVFTLLSEKKIERVNLPDDASTLSEADTADPSSMGVFDAIVEHERRTMATLRNGVIERKRVLTRQRIEFLMARLEALCLKEPSKPVYVDHFVKVPVFEGDGITLVAGNARQRAAVANDLRALARELQPVLDEMFKDNAIVVRLHEDSTIQVPSHGRQKTVFVYMKFTLDLTRWHTESGLFPEKIGNTVPADSTTPPPIAPPQPQPASAAPKKSTRKRKSRVSSDDEDSMSEEETSSSSWSPE